jgi:hypothetical protein
MLELGVLHTFISRRQSGEKEEFTEKGLHFACGTRCTDLAAGSFLLHTQLF